MEGIDVRHRCDPDQVKPVLNTRENSTQTDSRIQGESNVIVDKINSQCDLMHVF